MDRNQKQIFAKIIGQAVALRKESVDRNHAVCSDHHKRCVALRKESVDRNQQLMAALLQNTESLSARRAWIEISDQ